MPIIYAKAPGKIILFGEHAVVYGQPAIAIPVNKVNATARVFPNIISDSNQIRIKAPDIQLDADLSDLPAEHPIAAAVRLAIQAAQVNKPPSLTLQISSTIPMSAGMGSSAAVTIAVIRALTDFLGHPLLPDEISVLAYEIETIQHGTPSGIDNTVIAHQKPVFFTQDESIQYLNVQQPTHWVIADTGEKTPTRDTVSAVRDRYTEDPTTYTRIFDQIGQIARDAREGLIEGDINLLGKLMNKNQRLLKLLGVSSHSLERQINAAVSAGAPGAKLSGGGRGGNIIALAPSELTEKIASALHDAGAQHVITTTLAKGGQ